MNSFGLCLFFLQLQSVTKVICSPEACLENDSCLYERDDCPVWFYCNSSNTCECGNTHNGIIKCSQALQLASVVDCYCVTRDEHRGGLVAGACEITCGSPHKHDLIDNVYLPLRSNVSKLNKEMCGRENRTGTLCGRCRDGHFPLAYSYSHACIHCPKTKWFTYALAAYLPLTAFYLFVLFFKINVNSSHLQAFVLYSQAISEPSNVRVLLSSTKSRSQMILGIKFMATFYGIWNLDFFKSFYSDICIHSNGLLVLALEYAIAIYPFILTLLSYLFIQLHDQNFRPLKVVWKPIKRVLVLFHTNWNSRASVIDAYVTFFLLSYMKLLNVSFNLLMPARLYQMDSEEKTYVLYFNGSMVYFGKEHLPYGILAITMFVIFNLLPALLLLLYQFFWFQKLLGCLPLKLHILHTYMDLLQGHFKNGTEGGTRDVRWFSAVYLFSRIANFSLYALSQSGVFYVLILCYSLLLGILLVSVQPYKNSLNTKIDATFIFFVAFLCSSVLAVNIAAIMQNHSVLFVSYILSVISSILPLSYMCVYAAYWVVSRRRFALQAFKKIRRNNLQDKL